MVDSIFVLDDVLTELVDIVFELFVLDEDFVVDEDFMDDVVLVVVVVFELGVLVVAFVVDELDVGFVLDVLDVPRSCLRR